MRKYLFICCTPLQGVIAKRIIETEGLEKSKCVLFFYTSFDNETYRKIFTDLSKLCIESLYYVWKPNFPKYVFDAKRFFGKYTFKRFYLASIDSIFAQLAMSKNSKPEIYTFDDGSANIIKTSHYYKKQKITFKRLVFSLMGNRYSTQKIKKKIIKHYTIYPNMDNIVTNLTYLPLFSNIYPNFPEISKEDTVTQSSKCIVILGTVYEEIFQDENSIHAIKRFIMKLSTTQQGYVCYIKHPREKPWDLSGLEQIQTGLIAEEIILSLLKKFNQVDIYSLGSSTQLNVAALPKVKNYFFNVPKSPSWLKDLRTLESKITGQPYKLIEV